MRLTAFEVLLNKNAANEKTVERSAWKSAEDRRRQSVQIGALFMRSLAPPHSHSGWKERTRGGAGGKGKETGFHNRTRALTPHEPIWWRRKFSHLVSHALFLLFLRRMLCAAPCAILTARMHFIRTHTTPAHQIQNCFHGIHFHHNDLALITLKWKLAFACAIILNSIWLLFLVAIWNFYR